MEKRQKSGHALYRVTFAAMWRRKKSSLLLLAVSAVSVFLSVFLQNLITRQETAIEMMVHDTAIQCIVTDARGNNTDSLRMPHGFVDRLLGRRHEQGCFLDESVKNVRAKASMKLKTPQDMTMRRILNIASDPALSKAEGREVQIFPGWTESVFLTDQRVCLIPESMEPLIDEKGNPYVSISMDDGAELELQVVGIVKGGAANVIWCPFYMQRLDDAQELIWVDSCSFDIMDNTKIEECKAAIYEEFVEPNLSNTPDIYTFGVLVQDETYQNTLKELRSNVSMLRLLLPVLTVLCIGIGFLAGYLTTRGRIREFAVMRCLGMKQGTVFIQTFAEYVLLSALGAIFGGTAGFWIERTLSVDAVGKAVLLVACFLIGTAVSVWNVTHVNTMKLMKTEE